MFNFSFFMCHSVHLQPAINGYKCYIQTQVTTAHIKSSKSHQSRDILTSDTLVCVVPLSSFRTLFVTIHFKFCHNKYADEDLSLLVHIMRECTSVFPQQKCIILEQGLRKIFYFFNHKLENCHNNYHGFYNKMFLCKQTKKYLMNNNMYESMTFTDIFVQEFQENWL